MANLICNQRLTPPTHFQDVRLITLDVSGSGMRFVREGEMVLTNLSSNKVCFITDRYVPGDVLMIKPQNVMEAVDEFVQVLKLDPDTSFVLKQNDPGLLHVHIKYYNPDLLGMFPQQISPCPCLFPLLVQYDTS